MVSAAASDHGWTRLVDRSPEILEDFCTAAMGDRRGRETSAGRYCPIGSSIQLTSEIE